jgi:hypothetical protein
LLSYEHRVYSPDATISLEDLDKPVARPPLRALYELTETLLSPEHWHYSVGATEILLSFEHRHRFNAAYRRD